MAAETTEALAAQDERRDELNLDELRALGVVLTVEADPLLVDQGGGPRYPLQLDSLESWSRHRENRAPRWLLLSVQPATGNTPESALVWVSDTYRGAFLKLFEDYLTKETPTGQPRNRTLVANMAKIRSATLRDLWQSPQDPPTNGVRWWELWLRPTTDGLNHLQQYAQAFGMRIASRKRSGHFAPSAETYKTRHCTGISCDHGGP